MQQSGLPLLYSTQERSEDSDNSQNCVIAIAPSGDFSPSLTFSAQIGWFVGVQIEAHGSVVCCEHPSEECAIAEL